MMRYRFKFFAGHDDFVMVGPFYCDTDSTAIDKAKDLFSRKFSSYDFVKVCVMVEDEGNQRFIPIKIIYPGRCSNVSVKRLSAWC